MCREAPAALRDNRDKSSLRRSRLLDAEDDLFGPRPDSIHMNCQRCGVAFSDDEKDKHMNHSGMTGWGGIVQIRRAICTRCRKPEADNG